MKKFNEILTTIFNFKRERRRELSDLPIEEKFKILLELQKIAYPAFKARGLYKKPWMSLDIDIRQIPDVCHKGQELPLVFVFSPKFSRMNLALPKTVDTRSHFAL